MAQYPMDDLDKQIAMLKREIDQKNDQAGKTDQDPVTTSIASHGTMPPAANPVIATEEKKENDARSIFIRGLDWNTTNEELSELFADCGTVERVTILQDLHANRPKGHAFVCFATVEAADNAVATKNLAILRGRTLTVTKKRTNIPGMKKHFVPRAAPAPADPNAAAMATAAATATMMAQMAQGMQHGGPEGFSNFMSAMAGGQPPMPHPGDGMPPPMRGRGYARGAPFPPGRGTRGRGGRGVPPYM